MNLSEHEEKQNYYKTLRKNNFGSNSYIEHKSNNDRNKTLYRFFWLDKKQKKAINPINKKDNKYFQNAVTVALNYEEIKKRSARNNKNETCYK